MTLSPLHYWSDGKVGVEFKWEKAGGRKPFEITCPGKIIQGPETVGVGRERKGENLEMLQR